MLLEYFLSQRPQNSFPTTNFQIAHSQFVLTRNYFPFPDIYHQICGTAKCNQMGASFVNMFMGQLEHKQLNFSPLKPLDWFWYIDDIFILWTHWPMPFPTFCKTYTPIAPHAQSNNTNNFNQCFTLTLLKALFHLYLFMWV